MTSIQTIIDCTGANEQVLPAATFLASLSDFAIVELRRKIENKEWALQYGLLLGYRTQARIAEPLAFRGRVDARADGRLVGAGAPRRARRGERDGERERRAATLRSTRGGRSCGRHRRA